MSDTPRTDASEYKQTDSNPPEPLGMVDADFARQLERELASVTKASLELEEERDELDRELQESDRRANSLERELAEAKIGAARYEYLRKLNPREFTALTLFCITADVRFDDEVDRRRNAK